MSNKVKMDIPYFQAPNSIFDAGLSALEIAVYMYLCRCGNHGGQAFPSYQTIANKCGISRASAIRTVKSLYEKHLLSKKTRPKGNKDNDTNIYYVLPPSVTEIPGSVTGTPAPSITQTPPSVRETPRKRTTDKEIDSYKETQKKEGDENPPSFFNDFTGIWNRNYQLKTGNEQEEITETQYAAIQAIIEQGISLTIWRNAVNEYFKRKSKTSNLQDFLGKFEKYKELGELVS